MGNYLISFIHIKAYIIKRANVPTFHKQLINTHNLGVDFMLGSLRELLLLILLLITIFWFMFPEEFA